MSSWNLAQQNLTTASLYTSNVSHADFTGAIVRGAFLGNLTGFTSAQLYSTASYASHDLYFVSLTGENMAQWDFTSQDLTLASFNSSNLDRAIFRQANLTTTGFYSADLTHANFTQATLHKAYFASAVGRYADFSQADLTDADFSRNLIITSLRDSTLTNLGLSRTSFQPQAYIGGTTIGYFPPPLAADLMHASFTDANLIRARFSSAFLVQASFLRSILTSADFTGADLRGATDWSPLASTITTNAILPDATIHGLALASGETLTLRNFSQPITVQTAATFDPQSSLQILLDAAWGSQLQFTADAGNK